MSAIPSRRSYSGAESSPVTRACEESGHSRGTPTTRASANQATRNHATQRHPRPAGSPVGKISSNKSNAQMLTTHPQEPYQAIRCSNGHAVAEASDERT